MNRQHLNKASWVWAGGCNQSLPRYLQGELAKPASSIGYQEYDWYW